MEFVFDDKFNLAALDIRNSEFEDIFSVAPGDEKEGRASWQHIGVKCGREGDRTDLFALVVNAAAPNVITNVLPPGWWEDDELIGATVEIIANPMLPASVGNTYPVIGNNDLAGTITVDVLDGAGMLTGPDLYTQLGGMIAPMIIGVAVKNYKWLPNFNRKIVAGQETISWELDKYALKDVKYLEIWLIRPGAVNIEYVPNGQPDKWNDQYFDIGCIFVYDEGCTTGRPLFMRIRDDAFPVTDQSEDILHPGSEEFYRTDLINRLGIRTAVLPDDKSLVDFDSAFWRCAQALYENLVIEDSYEIDGVYFPNIPRYSTILLNIESMRIALPALLESRSFTFAGLQRTYRWVLRNYNNAIWEHFEHPIGTET